MNCPNCQKTLGDNLNDKLMFCPFCGERLFEDSKDYLVQIVCSGQRNVDGAAMMVFVDDTDLYEVRPGETICISVKAGFHVFKFRHKIRTKVIQILVSGNYIIRAFYNSLSSLIETSVAEVDEKDYESVFKGIPVAEPIMVSRDGQKGFDVILGEDEPEFEFRATTGLKEGILRVYSERLEFTSETDFKKEIINFREVLGVRKKLGSVDIQLAGNVHKIYSIPKDIYNEVMAFLNNRLQ